MTIKPTLEFLVNRQDKCLGPVSKSGGQVQDYLSNYIGKVRKKLYVHLKGEDGLWLTFL